MTMIWPQMKLIPKTQQGSPRRQGAVIAVRSLLVMLNFSVRSGLGLAGSAGLALVALTTPAMAQGAALGPAAAICNRNGSAVLVDVSGFKARSGILRVQLYAAGPRALDKGTWLERVELAVPRGAVSMPVCVEVKKPGNYVIAVRHDLNGNGKSDRADGGGMSGNPDMSLMDVVMKRKPSLRQTSFAVGTTTRRVPVVLNYVNGMSFDPVK